MQLRFVTSTKRKKDKKILYENCLRNTFIFFFQKFRTLCNLHISKLTIIKIKLKSICVNFYIKFLFLQSQIYKRAFDSQTIENIFFFLLPRIKKNGDF